MKKFHHLSWDNRNIDHIAKHNVTADEAEQAVFASRTRIRKGKGANIYYLFGRTEAGRYLFIVLVAIGKLSARVITAREYEPEREKMVPILMGVIS